MKPAMTPQQAALSDRKESALALYRAFVCREGSLPYFLFYELATTVFSGLPGMMGFGMRRILFPHLLRQCGPAPAFGRGVTLRNPLSVSLGRKVLIDDYVTLDAHGKRSDGQHASIQIGDHVSIGRFSTVAAKGGHIELGSGVNIGTYCRVATQSYLEIGESTLVAAYCYIGPGNHQTGDADTPLIAREMEIKGGVRIGKNVWIGARATILDGVTIGDGAIVGAHSLVRDNVPAGEVVAGTPARIIPRR